MMILIVEMFPGPGPGRQADAARGGLDFNHEWTSINTDPTSMERIERRKWKTNQTPFQRRRQTAKNAQNMARSGCRKTAERPPRAPPHRAGCDRQGVAASTPLILASIQAGQNSRFEQKSTKRTKTDNQPRTTPNTRKRKPASREF